MTEPDVYLEKLSAFSRMLHLENLSVSPKETEDAARLLIALGMDDRERVKTALRTVYAKSREEQITFDRVFDGFFLSEEQIRRQAKEQMERTICHSENLAISAFHLGEFGYYAPVLENILCAGLQSVRQLVFSGEWKTRRKQKKQELNQR